MIRHPCKCAFAIAFAALFSCAPQTFAGTLSNTAVVKAKAARGAYVPPSATVEIPLAAPCGSGGSNTPEPAPSVARDSGAAVRPGCTASAGGKSPEDTAPASEPEVAPSN